MQLELDYQASREVKGEVTFLSYLFRESGTVVSTFERSENVANLSGPHMQLASYLQRGVWPTWPYLSAHAYIYTF